jgi:hypothetical protein
MHDATLPGSLKFWMQPLQQDAPESGHFPPLCIFDEVIVGAALLSSLHSLVNTDVWTVSRYDYREL